MRTHVKILMVLGVFLFQGCAALNLSKMSNGSRDDSLIDAVGNEVQPIAAKKMPIKLSRATLKKKLELGGDANKARLVEIYRRNAKPGDKTEFRILDVTDQSVYQMLGLRSHDVLVAANNFPIPSPAGFWHYVNQVPRLEEANLYIRRGGVPILFEYKFIR